MRIQKNLGKNSDFFSYPFGEYSLEQKKYIYSHSWEPNMLVMWDNRSVNHRAQGGYEGYKRLLHRITLSGDRPF